MTLDVAVPERKAVIKAFRVENAITKRLMEMGFIPGEVVKVLRYAPMGDPMLIEIMGSRISIRKKEASLIEVEYL